jgi:hypothetical protein
VTTDANSEDIETRLHESRLKSLMRQFSEDTDVSVGCDPEAMELKNFVHIE